MTKLTRRDLCLASLAPFLPFSCAEPRATQPPALLERLAFGSCNKQDQLQNHWRQVLAQDPQAWLWLGDTIYADEAAPRVREAEYLKLKHSKDYRQLRERCFISGIWDDHDYASNDAGADYVEKAASQKLFLDFLGEQANSPRRQQTGIYHSLDLGSAPSNVQLIMLDFRSFKAQADREADPLGPAQWSWLAEQIRRPGPALKLLLSSVQVLSPFVGKEAWASFPSAKNRLLALIDQSPSPLLILSGDRHAAEVSEFLLPSRRKLFELTSSGLTHASSSQNSNLWRYGEQILSTNFGLLRLQWSRQATPSLEALSFEAYVPQTGQRLLGLELSPWS